MHKEDIQMVSKYSHFGSQFWQFLTKLNILLSYDPAILLPGIHANELKTYVGKEIFTQMFITALFISVQTLKLPTCPTIGEC